MELKPGQVVLLKDTRERARVINALEDDKYLVEAEMDQERFAVHEDAIDPVVGTGQRAARPKPSAEPAEGDIRLYPDEDGPAVQVACLPMAQLDYNVVLLNFSKETLMFSVWLRGNNGQQWSKQGLIGPVRGLELGQLPRDLLNENAEIELQLSRKAEAGTDSKQERTLKLKPKLFFKNTRSVSWFADEVAVFDMFAKAKLVRATPAPKASTTEPATPSAPAVAPTKTRNAYGVMAAAEFSDELDLHADKLGIDASNTKEGDIVAAQLKHLDDYLEAAIRLGIPRVYVIHGKGSGALRMRVHEQLKKMGDIEGFKHEYHPKYGHGATEVQLLP